ncbi:hypothetical protein HDU97_000438 [Phlyctochytrium planicorne]|nr:hypothetical protein HDU97_000438 [Phlyctochytrium planicorne]
MSPFTISAFHTPGNNHRKQVEVGSFCIELLASPAQIRVHHKDDSSRTLLSSVPNKPFIRAATGEDDFTEGYGTFKIIDHDFYMTETQTVESFELKNEDDVVCAVLSGKLTSLQAPVPIAYSLSFSSPSPAQLKFSVHIHDIEDRFRKIFLTIASTSDERFFGFGEQLTHFDLKGKKVPIMVREDGVGRGVQPVTMVTNMAFGPYAGGDDVSAYKPVPFYITSKLNCLFLESSDYSMFDLTTADRVHIKLAAPSLDGRIIYGTSPLNIIEEYTSYSGRMEPLPEWALKGVIAGIQGGEKKVQDIVEKMKKAKIPIAALCFLADIELGGKPSYRRNLFKEALERDYLVKDEEGVKPLSINSGPNFRAGLVDLFNPKAFEWLRDVMVTEVFREPSVKGYMSDFAEFLPPGATLTDGSKASSADHNEYAEKWSQLQQAALKIVGAEDKVVFHRSGFTRSPGSTRLFWTGDQLVSWDGCDGIKAGLVGILSSGLAGFSLNHSDVGGYSGLMLEILGVKFGHYRSKELLLRWMELGAYGLVFRTHEGSMPQVNAQFYDDEETLKHMAYCTRVFASLAPYKKVLMEQAAAWGVPVIRHLFLHFHTDNAVFGLKEQFLLGPSLLVRPVMDPNTKSVKVYLPQLPENRKWFSAYTKRAAETASYPCWVTVDAPLGRPAVFVDEEALSEKTLAGFFETINQ